MHWEYWSESSVLLLDLLYLFSYKNSDLKMCEWLSEMCENSRSLFGDLDPIGSDLNLKLQWLFSESLWKKRTFFVSDLLSLSRGNNPSGVNWRTGGLEVALLWRGRPVAVIRSCFRRPLCCFRAYVTAMAGMLEWRGQDGVTARM